MPRSYMFKSFKEIIRLKLKHFTEAVSNTSVNYTFSKGHLAMPETPYYFCIVRYIEL